MIRCAKYLHQRWFGSKVVRTQRRRQTHMQWTDCITRTTKWSVIRQAWVTGGRSAAAAFSKTQLPFGDLCSRANASFVRAAESNLAPIGQRLPTALQVSIYTVSQKRHWCCTLLQRTSPILVIFGRNVAERVCYRVVICCPTSRN